MLKEATSMQKDSAKEITKAARALFLERGYDGVNLEAVAKQAGRARQTLYNNFASKEAIFKAVLNDHWASLSGCSPFSGSKAEQGYTAEGFLRDFAIRMLRFVDEVDQVEFTRLIIAESRRAPWIGQEFYEVGKKPLLLALAHELESLTQNGILRCSRPEIAAHQFFGMVQEISFWPFVMATGSTTGNVSREEIIDEAVKTFLARYATPVVPATTEA
ncbi:TetR/AcrR family transcriptional regulator [Rhizobium sp. CSW-27]|uniref:TetR/AcrR family transcriptional regulator n=1 Tax=Rhizobium sp. CSW-27 TaxID=2839985 RepID=UPI001C0216C5|nr:TetR/AcrR family transcriptional regulator [Rhizobium sp. CSW-27]MBT9372621.1 TetR/AcrR family transcriptional regulator [Rhizobium sp. CSW-27]